MQKCVNPKCNNHFTPKSHVHAFCSDKCRRAARGRDWSMVREKALWRDSHICKDCGTQNCRLEVHHIQPLYKGGTNELSNLRTLCVKCHRAVHKTWRLYEHIGHEHIGSEVYYYAA